jgi:drug/metabolite transporter (DMT)-like permease
MTAATNAPEAAGHVRAYLLLTVAALAWGGNVVASRYAIGAISPMMLTCLRWAIVVAIFVGMGPRRGVGNWGEIRPYLGRALVMGAAGYTVFSAALYVAAYFTSAVNLAILQGAIPVLVLLGGFLLRTVRADPMQILGVIATLAGVAVVACKGDLAALAALRFNFGDVLMLLGAASYAGYTLALRRRPALPAMTFFFLMALGAFLSSLPLLGIEIATGHAQWPNLQGCAVLLFVGLFPSLIAQRCYMRGVELIGPARAGLFVNLVPVFGAFLSVAMLGETFGAYHAAALALVLAGILLAEHNALPWSRRSGA